MDKIVPHLAVTSKERHNHSNNLSESFKGEVFDKNIKFPKELGAEHPFDFEVIENTCKKVGYVKGAMNKIVTSILGDFTVKIQNENAQTIIDSFVHDSDFINKSDSWIMEGVTKGNGFMELDLENSQIRVMNANNMYVRRNKVGKVLEYNQYTGNMARFTINSKKLIAFKPNQMAHLTFNKVPNDPYGIGMIFPGLLRINDMLGNDRDLHKLSTRKAGAPIHVKVGVEGEAVDTTAIDDFKESLQYMTNSTEWVSDANVDMKVLDFGNIGQNLIEIQNHDFRMLLAGFNIPEVMMGSGQLNEGIARVQQDTWKNQVASWRLNVQTVMEEKIFRPLLKAQKNKQFDGQIEFIWSLPSEEEKNLRLDQLQKLLNTFGITENMKRGIQLEIAEILGLDDLTKVLIKPEKGADEEAEEEAEIQQPEVPGAKPNAKEEAKVEVKEHICNEDCECGITEKQSAEMGLREFVNLKEIAGFNYSDYLINILKKLRGEKFINLAAITEQDLVDGLLNQSQVKKLKIILKNGFRRNQTIKQIEKEISQLDLSDRMKGDKITMAASSRPIAIARTETVRLANEGLVETFKQNNIQRVRWLAALSDRTCPICEALNGRVFNINELNVGASQPPAHVGCRCSLISVVE